MSGLALALRTAQARPLDLPDAPALQALLARCADYFRAADGVAPGKNAALERISEALGDAQLRLFGIFQRELVGLLELRLDEPSDRDATIVLLLVDPAQRRSGLGREVVEACCAALGLEGFEALHLGVQDHEHGAHTFWTSLGFEPASTEPGITNYVRALGGS